jgi:hypothetical protein
MPERERRALERAQPGQRFVHPCPHLAAFRQPLGVGRPGLDRRGIVERIADLLLPGMPGPHHVHGAVRDDSVQPGREVGAGFEASQLPIRPEKAFLHHILGILLVAGHPKGQLKRTPAVPLHQDAESLAVALLSAGEDRCHVAGVHPNRLDGLTAQGVRVPGAGCRVRGVGCGARRGDARP